MDLSKPVMRIELPFPVFGGQEKKVREVYDLSSIMPGTLLMVTTDRMSAFDVVMKTGILYKGIVLNQISGDRLRKLEDSGVCDTHLISDDFADFPPKIRSTLASYEEILAGRSMLVKKGDPVKIEGIYRKRLFGSGFKGYVATGMVCGIKLPLGLEEGDLLPTTIYTPSTKAAAGLHDENISFAQTINMVGRAAAQQIRAMTLSVAAELEMSANSNGYSIADGKLEFVKLKGGKMIIGDEVGTSDSSRFTTTRGKVLNRDKEWFRQWLISVGFDKKTPMEIPEDIAEKVSKGYIEGYEMITGKTFAY